MGDKLNKQAWADYVENVKKSKQRCETAYQRKLGEHKNIWAAVLVVIGVVTYFLLMHLHR